MQRLEANLCEYTLCCRQNAWSVSDLPCKHNHCLSSSSESSSCMECRSRMEYSSVFAIRLLIRPLRCPRCSQHTKRAVLMLMNANSVSCDGKQQRDNTSTCKQRCWIANPRWQTKCASWWVAAELSGSLQGLQHLRKINSSDLLSPQNVTSKETGFSASSRENLVSWVFCCVTHILSFLALRNSKTGIRHLSVKRGWICIQYCCVNEQYVGSWRRRGRNLAVSSYPSILYPWRFADKLVAQLSVRQLLNLWRWRQYVPSKCREMIT